MVVVSHNSEAHIEGLLVALAASDPAPVEVVVVDNASTDATKDIVSRFPVRWLPLDTNTGFGFACNRGFEATSAPLVTFFNPDSRPGPDWVHYAESALADTTVGAAMAEVSLLDRPDRFNNSGGTTSVLGFAWITDLGEPIPTTKLLTDVSFPMGAAFAIRREVFERLEGFREDLFLYLEDTDLGWRLRLLGLRTVRVGGWRVTHDYEFARNEGKFTLLERNRRRLLKSNYRTATRVLLTPIILLGEAGVVATSLLQGWLGPKLAAYRDDGGDSAQWGEWVRTHRVAGDAKVIEGMLWGLPHHPNVPRPPGTGVIESIIRTWVRMVLPIIRWFDQRAGLE